MAVKSNNGILTDSDEANRFNVEKGICGVDGTVSFESVEHPGMFLQAIRKKIKLQRFTSIKSKDTACFYPRQEKYFAVSLSFGKIKKILYINGLSAFRILTWNFRFLKGPTFVQTVTIQNEIFYRVSRRMSPLYCRTILLDIRVTSLCLIRMTKVNCSKAMPAGK